MAIKLFPLGITGEEVKRRLNLAVHNSLFFDNIVTTISPTVNETKVTSASNYTIVYLSGFSDDDVHHGIFALLVDGTYYINWSIERGGETVTDSAWYNNGYIVRSDRTFICRSDRQLYIYDNTQMYRVTNDGITPHIDPTTKHWMIGDEDTGIVAEGKDGEDGKSAYQTWLETDGLTAQDKTEHGFLVWLQDRADNYQGPFYAATVSGVTQEGKVYYVPGPDSDKYRVMIFYGGESHVLATRSGMLSNYTSVYDISAANENTPYSTLQQALAAITDDSVKKGGMTIKYIGTDGKYHQYRYTLADTTGDNFTDESNWVLSELPIENTSDADLEFSDNDGNVLARYKNGHHETKYWSSDKSQQNTGERDYDGFSTSSDYAIGDIVIKGGLLYKFISEHAAGVWDDSEVEQTSIAKIISDKIPKDIAVYRDINEADLEFSDDRDRVVLRVRGGDLETKNFNSKNAVINKVASTSFKRYKRQIDTSFIFENVGLIGNWVKRQINSVNVVSTYSAGSELVFQVRGTASVVANFINTGNESLPEIAYQVDNGGWNVVEVSSTVNIATGLDAYEHTIRIKVSGCILNEGLYTSGIASVNFSGLTIDNNALIYPLDTNNKKILFVGDSITAGVGSSAYQGYAYLLADMLNAQNIHSALAGCGLVHGSRNYLPTSIQMLQNLIQGHVNFINEPDIIFIMIGTNDGNQTGASDFTAAYVNLLEYLRKRFGGCHIFACSPFNGTHQSDTQLATQLIDNVTWIGTNELKGTYTTLDGTHPDAAGAIVCANYCYEKIKEVLNLIYFN